jgi:DNA-binding MurR/RpiR family transcriptional regulator
MIAEEITAEDLLDRMADQLHAMSPQLQQAARYIVDHPMEVGVNSMRKLAELAGVTPNTLTRLARAVGFESFEHFRNLFRDAVRQHTRRIPDRARWLQSIGVGSRHALIVSQMASAMLLNVEQLYSNLDTDQLEAAARRIIAARVAYVVGVRGAYSLAHNFHYVARMALPNLQLVPRQASTPLDDIIGIGPEDLVLAIALAPYARQTVEAVRFARERGAAVVAVTDSRGSPLAAGADHALISPSGTPQFFNSIVGAAAVLETLMAMLVALGDDRMLASIRLYDRIRHERKAYWLDRGPGADSFV